MFIQKALKWASAITAVAVIAASGAFANVRADFSGNVPVIYEIEESASFPVDVTVEGRGAVRHGDTTVTSGTERFMLKMDEEMTFDLAADQGNKLLTVHVNGEDVTAQVSDSKLVVQGAEKDQTVKVVFSNVSTETKPGGGPATGDDANVMLYAALGGGAAILLLLLFKTKKTEKTGA